MSTRYSKAHIKKKQEAARAAKADPIQWGLSTDIFESLALQHAVLRNRTKRKK